MFGADRLDASWPPVLVIVVVGLVSATTLSFVVVLRRLRSESRAQRRKGRPA
jgi:hypothetical protein